MLAARPAMGRTGGWRAARPGPRHHNWRGDKAGYQSIHDWVKRHKAPAVACVSCGVGGDLEWANRSGQYYRDVDDYFALCRSCHRRYDMQPHMRGASIRRFGDKA